MDRPVSADDAGRSFPEILQEVSAGSSFVVTAHGRPVARIVPVEKTPEDRLAARARLFERAKAQPTLNLGPWTRDELYERPGKDEPSR